MLRTFNLSLPPLLLIHIVTNWLFSCILFRGGKAYSFAILGCVLAMCELQMCMAFGVANDYVCMLLIYTELVLQDYLGLLLQLLKC